MTRTYTKLALIAIAALPLAAQTPDSQVSFKVEILQAANGAATAIEAQRLFRQRNIRDTDDIALHLLRENAPIDNILRSERRRGTLETIDVPVLTARNTLPVDFLIGGEHPLPVVPDEASLSALPPNVPRPDPPQIMTELGIRLKLRPIILPDDSIRIRVEAIVSGVDFGQSTLRSGYLVPAVSTRRLNQLIDIQPGQPFILTGVVNQQSLDLMEHIPEVAQHRLVQAFQNQRSQKPDSDLLVIITPTVIPNPAD
jgi:Flp pilus assembly secretin CpaC